MVDVSRATTCVLLLTNELSSPGVVESSHKPPRVAVWVEEEEEVEVEGKK